MKPTDPAAELPRQAGQPSWGQAKQRVDLVRSELHSELETRAGGVPEKLAPERGVRQHATERPFNISLAHSLCPRLPRARKVSERFGRRRSDAPLPAAPLPAPIAGGQD
jgi:hypothetical protein